MNDLIIGYHEGKLPKSVESALINQQECINQINGEIESIEVKINDLEQKLNICTEIGMPSTHLKKQITRFRNDVKGLIKARTAYEAGFLEIPELNSRAPELDTDNDENRNWQKAVLPKEAPLRVYEDLKAAKESGLFESIVFYTPTFGNSDPIIAGRIGRRVFLIANYH